MYSIFGRKVAGWTKQNVLNRVKSGIQQNIFVILRYFPSKQLKLC